MDLKKLSMQLKGEIDQYCVDAFSDGHRTHLGASIIGHECSYYLWLVFRWAFKEDFSGRMLRLFNRGHLEELRFVRWLEGIGCRVETDDFSENLLLVKGGTNEYFMCPIAERDNHLDCADVSNDPAHVQYAKFIGVKIPQFTISGVNGHFGGSMDGKVWLPEHYGFNGPLILEGKTHKDSGFSKLEKNGVLLEKPQHFDQQSTYGYKTGIKYAVYMCTNKNNDEIYPEFVELDHNRGKQCEQKADRIINSKEPPYKLSSNKTFHKCVYCPARPVCHEGAIPEKNCRSCLHSKPIENKKWLCEKWNVEIPKEHILTACDNWHPITLQ